MAQELVSLGASSPEDPGDGAREQIVTFGEMTVA